MAEYYYAENGAQRLKKEVSFYPDPDELLKVRQFHSNSKVLFVWPCRYKSTKPNSIQVYHPVSDLQIQVNGKKTVGSTQVLRDSRVELRCIANGYPLPKFTSPQGENF